MTPLGYSESITFCHSDNVPSQNLDLLLRQIVGTVRRRTENLSTVNQFQSALSNLQPPTSDPGLFYEAQIPYRMHYGMTAVSCLMYLKWFWTEGKCFLESSSLCAAIVLFGVKRSDD